MRRQLALFGVVIALAASTRSNPDSLSGGSGFGVVRAAISQVPPTINCVQLVATRDGVARPSNFDVVPGTAASLQIADAPVGELTVAARAFTPVCAGIGGAQATWASDAVSVTVHAGEVTPLRLTLEPVGGVGVDIEFGSDGGADMPAPADMAAPADLAAPADMAAPLDSATPDDLAPSPPDLACNCSPGLICCAGLCVDPNSNPNHCGGCSQTCASGRCGLAFGSASVDDWSFNGSASYDTVEGAFVLTRNIQNQAGTVIYRRPIRTGNFDVRFDFRITPAPASFPADGLAFVIEKEGPTAVGAPGSGFGVAGLTGYGVEFDTYNNMNPITGGGGCGDVSFDHISVDSLTVCRDYNNNPLPTPLASSGAEVVHPDGLWHGCSISVAGGLATVTVDGIQQLSNLPLTGFLSGDSYHFGFGAGTGMSYATHEVRAVVVTLPAAQCL